MSIEGMDRAVRDGLAGPGVAVATGRADGELWGGAAIDAVGRAGGVACLIVGPTDGAFGVSGARAPGSAFGGGFGRWEGCGRLIVSSPAG
jgi:hypothetical protein